MIRVGGNASRLYPSGSSKVGVVFFDQNVCYFDVDVSLLVRGQIIFRDMRVEVLETGVHKTIRKSEKNP